MQSLEFSNNKVRIPIIHWHGPNKNSPVFHWAHATGFNGETYKTVLKAVSQVFHVYAWDLRGHGKSSENTSLIDDNHIYENYVEDLCSIISWLHTRHQSKIYLGGHSIGGTISISAASKKMPLVSALVLVDPVIFQWHTKYLMDIVRLLRLNVPNAYLSLNAKKRRNDWPNVEALIKSYEGRGAFKTWKKPFLDDYLKAGTIKKNKTTQLSCHPSWESRNFKAFDKINIISVIKDFRLPIRLLLASQGSTTKALSAFKRNENTTYSYIKDSTHFIPMEYPKRLQAEIFNLLKE